MLSELLNINKIAFLTILGVEVTLHPPKFLFDNLPIFR